MKPTNLIKFCASTLALIGALVLFNSCHKSKGSSTWVFNGYETYTYATSDSSIDFINGTDTTWFHFNIATDSNISISHLMMQINPDGSSMVVKNLIDGTVCGFPYGSNYRVPDTLVLGSCANCSTGNYQLYTSCNTGVGIDVELSINGDNATLTYNWLVEIGATNAQYATQFISLQGKRQ